ncbi:FtsQ-type POTRA domain-containing protein [bacterium]|nr:FtsQ-type POTRA domain-containing protein [bacterium]
MKRFLEILSGVGYLFCTYVFVSLFAAVFCFAGDTFETFKNSEKMLITPENVEVYGNSRLGRDEILFVSGLDKKISFFDADSKKMTLNLTTCGWVKKAFVEKFFPNSVKIHIEEFQPVMIVNSRKKSQDSDKDLFMMWFSDADGILFKRVVPGELSKDIPVFFLNYSTQEEDKKRPKKIKDAIFITEKWKNISSLCKLKSITYEILAGYSIECSSDRNLRTVVRLKDEFSNEEWIEMMQDAAAKMESLVAKNQWAGEYEFDRVENGLGDKKHATIIGKYVENIKKGEH